MTTAGTWATSASGGRWPTCWRCWRALAGRGANAGRALAACADLRARGCGLRRRHRACGNRRLPCGTPGRGQSPRPSRIAAESAARGSRGPDGSRQRRRSRDRPSQGAAASPPVTAADAPSMQTYDPWERLNRFTYRFNARFDEAVFLPVANVYRRVPSPIRAGVHNFFGNLSEVDSVINYALQWRLKLERAQPGPLRDQQDHRHRRPVRRRHEAQAPGSPDRLEHDAGQVGDAPGALSGHSVSRAFDFARRHRFLGDYGTSYGINVAKPVSRQCVLGIRAPSMRSISARTSAFATIRPARPSSMKISASSTCASA